MLTDIENLSRAFKSLPHFDLLAELAVHQNGYIVGGAVRDALIGAPITDIDLVFPEDPTSLARNFAASTGGNWFWLDETRRQSRVVAARGDISPDFDFAPFRAPSLGQDLLDRDFTINSIALSLDELSAQVDLVDPLCGLEDLEADVLRMSSVNSFASDPLRIIKGVRHATVLELAVEAGTLQCMQKNVTELYRIAPERIRQEVWKIFAHQNATFGLQLMSHALIGNYLFGNNYSASVESLCGLLESYRAKLGKFSRISDSVSAWLAEDIEQGLARETLLLWTLLLNDLDRSLPLKLAEEWLLSRKAKALIAAVSDLNEGHTEKFVDLPVNARAFVWWAAFLHVEPESLLLTLSLINEDDEQAIELLRKWLPLLEGYDFSSQEDLVSGHWLRTELGLEEGPEMATAQRLVRHAEIIGDVFDEAGAKELLRRHYANMD